MPPPQRSLPRQAPVGSSLATGVGRPSITFAVGLPVAVACTLALLCLGLIAQRRGGRFISRSASSRALLKARMQQRNAQTSGHPQRRAEAVKEIVKDQRRKRGGGALPAEVMIDPRRIGIELSSPTPSMAPSQADAVAQAQPESNPKLKAGPPNQWELD